MNVAYYLLFTSVTVILYLSFYILQKTKKIKEEKENFFTIIDNILCVITFDGKIVTANYVWKNLAENKKVNISNMNFFSYLTDESYETFKEKIFDLKHRSICFVDTSMSFYQDGLSSVTWSVLKDDKLKVLYLSGKDFTNERFVNEQLQQSEEKSRRQFKSVPIPTYTWKRITDDFVLADYNDIVYAETEGKIRHLLGISVNKVLRNNFEIIKDMDQCYITRSTLKKEVKYYIEESNEYKYYNVSYAFVPPDTVMVHMEDTTHKKLMEIQIKENEEKYRTLFNTTSDSILLVNTEGKVIEFNKASTEMFAYPADVFLNSDIQSIIKMKNSEINSPLISKVEEFIFELFNKSIIDGFIEIICIKKNGEFFPAEVQSQFIKIKNDNILLLYIRDISQRKAMEKALRDSEAQLRTAFENLPFDFWISDDRLNISMQSKYSIDLWGNLINKNLNKLPVPKNVNLQWLKASNETLAGKLYSTEVNIEINNEMKTFLQMFVPVVSESQITGILSINIDITEAKQNEIELKKYSDSLERANQELKTFAYIISHDLKAPLRAINNLIEWVIEDYYELFNQEGKNMLNLLTNRVNRMHELIESILRYSRIGRIDVTIEETDLNQLIETTVNLLHIPKNVRVEVQKNLPVIKLPRVYVQQIFQNLISNAIKFSNKPEGLIEINFTENEKEFIFSVKDNGPGIEKQYFDKIFQIFQTLQPRDEYESTGIGLSIVKKIIDNYNGSIWLESEKNIGTVFYFSLPKKF